MIFALIQDTKLISSKDLFMLAKAMQVSADRCAQIWGLASVGIVACDSFDSLAKLPTCMPVILTEHEADTTALAYHDWDIFRQGVAARVFVDLCSGFNTGDESVAESCSHEVVEALVDPQCNRWVDWPGNKGLTIALEVADPSQLSYMASVNGTSFQLANFVTPAYFDMSFSTKTAQQFTAGGGKFDLMGEFTEPGVIGHAGYAVYRNANGKEDSRYGSDFGSMSANAMKAKLHPSSRTRRRGVTLERQPEAPTLVTKRSSMPPKR